VKIQGLSDTGALAAQGSPAVEEAGSGDAFGAALRTAMDGVEETAASADAAGEGLVTGEVDLHEAMVSMEKADLVLRIAGTVRNKVIDAYQQLVQAAGG